MFIQQGKEAAEDKGTDVDGEDVDDSENAEGTTVFVKNLNFETSEETLKEVRLLSVRSNKNTYYLLSLVIKLKTVMTTQL